MVIDSDMFLIKPFSVLEYMKGYQLAGVPQSRGDKDTVVEYLWNGLVFMDMPHLPERRTIDFNCGRVKGFPVDVGGQTYHYIQKHQEVAVKFMGLDYLPAAAEQYHDSVALMLMQAGYTGNNMEFLINRHFLHYRGGTNWDQKSPHSHAQKWSVFKNALKKTLES